MTGSDYSGVSSALLFSATSIRDCVDITIRADGLVEPDEIFSINLITTNPDVSLNVSMGSVTIVDSDSKISTSNSYRFEFVAENRFLYNLQLQI